MKRILMMVFRNLFFVPYGWIKLCWYASHVENYTEAQRYEMLRYIVYLSLIHISEPTRP